VLAPAIATALYFTQKKNSKQMFHNVVEELPSNFGKPATSDTSRR